jgi:hypothetical protein
MAKTSYKPYEQNHRLTTHIKRKVSNSVKGFLFRSKIWWETYRSFEYERLLEAEAAFLACPSSIESTDNGNFLRINGTRVSQLFYIASPSKIDPAEGGIRKNADPFVLDKILEVTDDKNIDLTLTQVIYKMSSLEESQETDKELTKMDWIKDTEVKTSGRYSRRIDHYTQDIEDFSKQSYDGTHRQVKQLLIARVDGEDEQKVEFTSAHLQMILRGHGVLTEVPKGGQLEALKSSLMSNEIVKGAVLKTMSDVAAAMWPGRNPNICLDSEGILIGYVKHGENAGTPIFWNPNDSKYMSKHLTIFGGSGSGKSTLQLYIDYNCVLAGCDFIHIFPKEDMGTSAIRMITEIGGQLIKIGDNGQNFNPLMVSSNPNTHGNMVMDRKKAYVRHKESVANFANIIIGESFSAAMSGVFKRSLSELYEDKGFVDKNATPINFDQWADGKNWPSLGDLVGKWGKWLDDESKRKDHTTLKALTNYFTDIKQGESLNWLDNKESFNPSGRFICIDVSDLKDNKRYQDAVTVLLVDIINTRLKSPSMKAHNAKRRTLVMLDEGANLLENPGMEKYIKRWFREARAGKCSIILDNQDTLGVKNILPILKSNTDATIFMCNMSSENIAEFEKDYNFTEKDKNYLMEPPDGDLRKFLFVMNGVKVPGRVILSNTQKQVFFNEEISLSPSDESYLRDGYSLIGGLEWIRDKGIMSDDWISGMTDSDLAGWTRVTKITPPIDGMSKVIWFRNDIAKQKLISGESPDHYATCYLLAGELIRIGCTKVIVNNWGGQGEHDADITCITPDGRRLWLEYEHTGSHRKAKIEDKKTKQMRFCDTWRCICQQTNETTVRKAVGRDFYLVRGIEVKNYLNLLSFSTNYSEAGASQATEA